MKFSGKVDNGQMIKLLNFGGDPDHLAPGTDPDRIATLVRRDLAEVCTVPVLPSYLCFCHWLNYKYFVAREL